MEFLTSDAGLVSMVFGSFYFLSKTIDYLVRRKEPDTKPLLLEEKIKDIHDSQKELLKAITAISRHQEKISYILETLIKKLD